MEGKQMDIEKIEELLEGMKNKPSGYHYQCWASGTTKAIDEWGDNPILKCKYYREVFSAIGNYPNGKGCGYNCKNSNCNGFIQGDWVLTEREYQENYTIDRIIQKIKMLY
jgi:hypothetical protein